MATNVSSSKILWYVGDFKNIWDDNCGRSDILSLDYIAFLNILSSEYLYVTNEYIVWKAIHDWVNFDKINRLKYLLDLIENCLRFGRLEKHFIDIFIFECDLFMELSNAEQGGLKDFIKNVLQTCQQNTADSFNLSKSNYGIHFLPRVTKQLLVCIDKRNGLVTYYDQQHNSWHSSSLLLQPPAEQHEYQLALLGSMLYAIGGHDDDKNITKQMWSRDLSDPSSQWTARADMNHGGKRFCSVALNNTIYVLGGEDTNKHNLRSCERYDSQLNQWSTVAEMNRKRYSASAAVINGCIYVAGEWNKKFERSVEKYDPQSDTWREVAPMTTARFSFALTPFAGRLWAIGGVDNGYIALSSCESYDPVTDTWREEAEMKEKRWCPAAIEFNGELYVLGGEEKKSTGKIIVEKYLPTIGKWVEDSTLQNKISEPKLLIIPPTFSSCFKSSSNE